LSIEFRNKWHSHEEARRWAVEGASKSRNVCGRRQPTITGREVSLPIAAIQIAWFENPHSPEIDYKKQARAEVLSPGQLRDKEWPDEPGKARCVSSKPGWKLRNWRNLFIKGWVARPWRANASWVL